MSITDGDIAEQLDLRPNSIQTFHVRDEAVTSPKIPDMAVTFPDKIDNPIWVEGFRRVLFTNATLTVFPAVHKFNDAVDVPAWVDHVSFFLDGTFQFTNTSGGDVLGSISILVDGSPIGFISHEAVNNQTQALQFGWGADVSGVAGASVPVGVQIIIQGATNTVNFGMVAGIMIGTR